MVTLTPLADFTQHLGADELIGLGVGLHDETIAILGVPIGNAGRGWRLTRALVAGPQVVEEVELEPVEIGWRVLAQPIASDHLLIVVRRVLRGDNALLFGRDGRLERSYHVGDGVAHALVDDAECLWVGYFDEGISGGDELARAGVNRFDSRGERTWSFGQGSATPIEDCYALNIDGREAWFYGCCEFELVHVAATETLDVWETNVNGARAIVRSGDAVALIGTFDDPWMVTTGELAHGGLGAKQSIRLTVPPALVTTTPQLIGRGGALYVLGPTGGWKAELLS